MIYTDNLTAWLIHFFWHGNQFSKTINSEIVIITTITINNHFNNANYVTNINHPCLERNNFNFLLKKVDFRGVTEINFQKRESVI